MDEAFFFILMLHKLIIAAALRKGRFHTMMAGLPGIRFVFWGEKCGENRGPNGIARQWMGEVNYEGETNGDWERGN